ncbi:MAG: sigma-70 family RNA polymerase sigma factor [Planctomycetes bacterium]|nr:sigma-70 family RNA polymerase sigma factor [Planctomycetota bacterium]
MSAAASLTSTAADATGGPARAATDSDVLLMERIRDGDQEAVVALVGRFQNELVGFFYHQCWDQLVAEELAQDVFVNVYRSRSRYQATAKVRTYLYRIAHNLWIDHLRRQKRHLSLDAEFGEQSMRLVDVLKAPDAPEDTSGRDHQVRERIHEALANLPEGQREVFVLANNHGMKYQEIAAILHIPEGTVKSRMHNAVRALRDELTDLIES